MTEQTPKFDEKPKSKTVSEWITTSVIDSQTGKEKFEQFELIGKVKKGGKLVTYDWNDAVSHWRKKQKKFNNTLLHNKKRWLAAKKEINFTFADKCHCATCTAGAENEKPNMWCKNLSYIKKFWYICCCLLMCDSGLNLIEKVGECEGCPRCCYCNLTNTKCDDCLNKHERFLRCRHLIDHSPCLFYDKMINDLTDDENWMFNDTASDSYITNESDDENDDSSIPMKKTKLDINTNNESKNVIKDKNVKNLKLQIPSILTNTKHSE